MTAKQEILWTALPNGVSRDGKLRLSVLVSPRLVSDPARPFLAPDFEKLGDFGDWPAVVNAMTFRVKVGSGAAVPAALEGAPADSSLWKSLFKDTTPVEPFVVRDLSTRNIRSFPVAAILGYVDNLYQAIAKSSPVNLPAIGPAADGTDGTLAGLLGDLGGITGHFRLPHGPDTAVNLRRHPEILDGLLGEDWRGDAFPPGEPSKPDEVTRAKAYAEYRRFHALDSAFAAGRAVPAGATYTSFGFPSPAAMDFYQAHRFYDRPEMIQPYMPVPIAAKVPPRPPVPKLDFHRILAALSDYPALLRMLGLVVDLTVDPELIPIGVGTLRVLPTPHIGPQKPATSTARVDRRPSTHFEFTGRFFGAVARPDSDLVDGMLRLDGTDDSFDEAGVARPFHLAQVDADGAALKLVNMASELWSVHNPNALIGASFDTPDTTGLPALQSAGVALVRSGRAVRLSARLADESARGKLANADDVANFADNLVRGYRVDVHDGTAWRSLCRREGTYVVRQADAPDLHLTLPDGSPIVDEGYVKSASSTSADAKESDLYFHEAVVRWDGWSLVAPRPGRTIQSKESADRLHQTEEIVWPGSEQPPDVPLRTSFVPVKGSLPRLRFGSSYRFRARAVDLAGNSLGPDMQREHHASEPVPYLRFEPVPPPAIVPRRPFREGESVERMVIRSNYDQTTAQYAATASLAPGHAPFEPIDDRHVVPPKTSQQMVETHGWFDEVFGPGADPVVRSRVFELATREAATLDSAVGSVRVEGTLAPDAPPLPSGREVPGAYVVNPEPMFQVQYLPDPVARGASLRGLPDHDKAEIVDFGAWPDMQPFILRIRERQGTFAPGECRESFAAPRRADWFKAERVRQVSLGKAEVAVVRYSCAPGDLLEHMGVWKRWVQPGADADTETLVKAGGHWMISPFRELVLVHAVQQPLCAPSARLVSLRAQGQTFAGILGRIALSVKSTGQIDLDATWKEPIDSLSDVGPRVLDGRGHVASLRVDARLPELPSWPTSPVGPDGTFAMPTTGGLPFGFPDVAELFHLDMKPFEARPIDHEFGDTKHRWVDYRLTGTTRFREYFPPEITSDPKKIARTGDSVRVNVLSSARPEAPKVLYIVPSFRWLTESTPAGSWTSFRRTRTGGGLRVWMDRPWYSSGEGEKLAVILWTDAHRPHPRPPHRLLEPVLTGFGQDPAWKATTPGTALHPHHFPNAVDTDSGLVLEESSKSELAEVKNATVSVAAFDPEYDADRTLWFCDIDLSPKAGPAYFPFVRLALARYQRQSVSGCQLSPVTQTDFAQLLPSRTLTVTFRKPGTVDITLYGPAPSPMHGNRVDVTLERHDGTVGDLGWRPVPATPAQPNPVHLADGLPDVSWIPPKIPAPVGTKRADMEQTNVRFRAQSRAVIARENLPTFTAREVAAMLEIDLGQLEGVVSLPVMALPGYLMWSGPMEVPASSALRGRVRLVVREYEHYAADDDVGRFDTDKRDPQIVGRYLDRVVYADIVDLP